MRKMETCAQIDTLRATFAENKLNCLLYWINIDTNMGNAPNWHRAKVKRVELESRQSETCQTGTRQTAARQRETRQTGT